MKKTFILVVFSLVVMLQNSFAMTCSNGLKKIEKEKKVSFEGNTMYFRKYEYRFLGKQINENGYSKYIVSIFFETDDYASANICSLCIDTYGDLEPEMRTLDNDVCAMIDLYEKTTKYERQTW